MSATCKGCGAPITWAKTPQGKNMPLQKVQAYEVDWERSIDDNSGIRGGYQGKAIKIERDVYVSHFLTCPKANQFSGGGRNGI